MTMANAFTADHFNRLGEAEQALIRRRERVLGPAYRLFYEEPLHFVRGEGVWLYDAQGRGYLDAYNNVASIGHGNAHVLQAMARQAETLNTHTRYLSETILAYAERLVGTLPEALSQVMFTCTGSEANDLALRIARVHTGGDGVIVTTHAYHGVTSAVSAFSPSLGEGVDLGPTVRLVAPPPPSLTVEAAGAAFAANVDAAVRDLKRHGIQPAMLIVDTIFSSDGVIADPPGFLAPAVEVIRAAGGLFVADEVQPGFGRTGEAMWGFQRHGIVPDMVTVGKPMGNGFPMGGLMARPEVLERFGRQSRYFNTFGGNPVAGAVGMAVLDVLEDQGLIGNSRDVGAYLRAGIIALGEEADGLLGDVRGAGLFIGADILDDGIPSPAAATRIVNGMRARGVLISASGAHANVLKIRPPLIFTKANADQLIDALRQELVSQP